jgi:hypothetical protein
VIADRPPQLDLRAPRSVAGIFAAALRLYWAFPVVFAGLALAVVAPYELIVLAVTGAAPLATQNATVSTALTLTLIDLVLIGPLISALHVHAVSTVGSGSRPQIVEVARRGLRVVPVVAAAEIIAGLGIFAGLILFIFPGLYLLIRWAVVAQTAAIEHTDWMGALRRSGELVRGNYARVLAFLVVVESVVFGLRALGVALAGSRTHALPVVLGIAVETLSRSLTALTTALLYFDLLARSQTRA